MMDGLPTKFELEEQHNHFAQYCGVQEFEETIKQDGYEQIQQGKGACCVVGFP